MRNGVPENELIDHAKATGGDRVTLLEIEDAIVGENYFTASGAATALGQPATEGMRLLTLCILTLWNGWTIVGKSACADPKSFDPELGRRLARTDAVNQIWPLLGFELKSKLARQPNPEDFKRAEPSVGKAERSEAASPEA